MGRRGAESHAGRRWWCLKESGMGGTPWREGKVGKPEEWIRGRQEGMQTGPGAGKLEKTWLLRVGTELLLQQLIRLGFSFCC